MVPLPPRRDIPQAADTLRDKSMSLKEEYLIFITTYSLFKGTAHRQRAVASAIPAPPVPCVATATAVAAPQLPLPSMVETVAAHCLGSSTVIYLIF
jgi:hypothetical protein